MAAILIMWISLLLFLPLYLFFKSKSNKKLPPSPFKLPILGNLHQLGDLIHQSYCQLSKKYGPVMLIRLGRIPVVVVSSAEAARDVMKVHDLACCSRPLFVGGGRISYNYLDVALAPYGPQWRNMKKLMITQLLTVKRVQSFRFIIEEEVDMLVNSISDSAASKTPIDLSAKFFSLLANITYRVSFGLDYRGNLNKKRFHEVVHEAEAVVGSFSKAELFPIIGWILDWISGFHARTERVFHELDTFFEYVINDHLKPGRRKDHDDIIDVLLAIKDEQAQLGPETDFTMDNIKGVLMNLFLGGIDGTGITMNWAMAELVKNPRVMQIAQEEVRNHVGNKGTVTESDLEKLKYLKMIIKETFRLHPAAPLLVPRETMSSCKVNGYDLDPKTIIQINAWAIGRDKKYWEEPEQFYPERFADSSIDYKGQDFELLPFGAGRRMCPGSHMAIAEIEYVLANLLYFFDWKLPEGITMEDINMEEEALESLAIDKKTHLILVPVKQLQYRHEDILILKFNKN